MTSVGVGIGTVSALMGIGGGTLTVPFLSYCSVPLKRAVGTAAAIGLPIAIAGSLNFIIAGLDEAGLPPGSLGYVHLPAFASITVASLLLAPVGARLAHALPERWLKTGFALFVLALATRMAWQSVYG